MCAASKCIETILYIYFAAHTATLVFEQELLSSFCSDAYEIVLENIHNFRRVVENVEGGSTKRRTAN